MKTTTSFEGQNCNLVHFFLVEFTYIRAVHGSGRVGFRPNPDSTRRRRVEGRSNPKPTAGKIGRFGFLSWLASVGSDRVPELKKASRSEEKASPESGIFAGN